MMLTQDPHIGYLAIRPTHTRYLVVCPQCASDEDKARAKVWHINIGYYNQTCCDCRTLIHPGERGFCELYDGN